MYNFYLNRAIERQADKIADLKEDFKTCFLFSKEYDQEKRGIQTATEYMEYLQFIKNCNN